MTLEGLRVGKLFPLIAALTLCAFTGCASSTVLQTQPPGATVSINGFVVGRTPYQLTDTKIVGSATPIRFEYPGYAPLDVMLFRNEEVDVLPLIGGIFVLVPFLWVMKYQANHNFQLQPATGGYAPPAQGYQPQSYPQTPGYPPAGNYPPAQGYPPPQAPPSAPPSSGPAGYPPPPPGYPPPAQ
jgi:hypothetical protein